MAVGQNMAIRFEKVNKHVWTQSELSVSVPLKSVKFEEYTFIFHLFQIKA